MSSWLDGPALAIDFESTDKDPLLARPVQIGMARLLPGEGVAQHVWTVNPGVDVPEETTAIHGFTTEHVRQHGRPVGEVIGRLGQYVTEWLRQGHPVIAMNASYDCTLLETELKRHGYPTITDTLGDFRPVIDPYVLHTHTSRLVSRKLSALCEYYGVDHGGEHDAGHDALAAARVTWKIGERNFDLREFTAEQLHNVQVLWRREHCDAKRAEYDGLGWKHDGWDPAWPVRQRAAVTA